MRIQGYSRAWSNDVVMSDIGGKEGCPLPPVTLFGLYNDELETYLDKIGWHSSLCG
jgi:hypothetical protein